MNINKDSGQVEVVGPYGRVYLYTHSTADLLVRDVFVALNERKRWDDADYLAKMVFCRMIPAECWKDEIGFGIGTQLYADINILITLDTVNQIITIQSALNLHEKYSMSFETFITSYLEQASI